MRSILKPSQKLNKESWADECIWIHFQFYFNMRLAKNYWWYILIAKFKGKKEGDINVTVWQVVYESFNFY